MKQKYILLILLASVNNVYAQDNTKVSKQPESTQPESKQNIKEDPNAKYRTDIISFAIVTSILSAGYIKGGEAGLLSQTSLDIFASAPDRNSYMYLSYSLRTPFISPIPNNVFTGTSFQTKIGFGHWVYKNLDNTKKGWLINLNIALIVDVYNSYVAKQGHSSLNGWISGMGLTANMRAIYQLHRDFGFVIGADISYYFPSSLTGLDVVHGFTGGITTGLAF